MPHCITRHPITPLSPSFTGLLQTYIGWRMTMREECKTLIYDLNSFFWSSFYVPKPGHHHSGKPKANSFWITFSNTLVWRKQTSLACDTQTPRMKRYAVVVGVGCDVARDDEARDVMINNTHWRHGPTCLVFLLSAYLRCLSVCYYFFVSVHSLSSSCSLFSIN